MPYINRIRLVNVRFNNDNSRYEDFRMVLEGKSTAYELINGGGKSVLLMMILQTILPNEPLKPEKPVKNIFIGGEDRTSHVLVEWVLEDGVYNKYLLTGFCAKKSREKDSDKTSLNANGNGIEYFNYYSLYSDKNADDIFGLNLFNEDNNIKSVMSYNELRSKMNKFKDDGRPVEVFENRKGEYQKFLKNYQLVQAEWDILKKINIRENNLANYFREDKSSRKLIENFLVDIIDKVAENKDKLMDVEFAEILVKMKQRFEYLQQQYDLLGEYDQYKNGIQRIIAVNENASQVYGSLDALCHEIICFLKGLEEAVSKHEILLESKNNEFNAEKNCAAEIEKHQANLITRENELKMQDAEINEAIKKEQLESCDAEIEKIDAEISWSKAINKHFDYKEQFSRLEEYKEELKKIGMDDSELANNRNLYGTQYRFMLEELLSTAISRKNSFTEEQLALEQEIIDSEQKISGYDRKIGTLTGLVNKIDKDNEVAKNQHKECYQKILQKGEISFLLYDIDEQISENNTRAETLNTVINTAEVELEQTKRSLNDLLISKTKDEGNLNLLNKEEQLLSHNLQEYEKQKEECDALCFIYNVSDRETLREEMERLQEQEQSRKNSVEQIIKDIQRDIEIIKKYGFYVFDHVLIEFCEYLKNTFNNVWLGCSFLKELSPDERETKLKKYRILPYSVMLFESDFNKLKNNPNIISKKFLDSMIPIVNADAIRGNDELRMGDILFPIRETEFFIESFNNIEAFETDLENKKEKKNLELQNIVQDIQTLKARNDFINRFIYNYPYVSIKEYYKNKEVLEQKIKTVTLNIKAMNTKAETLQQSIGKLATDIQEKRETAKNLVVINELLAQYKELSEKIKQHERDLSQYKASLDAQNELLKNETTKKSLLQNNKEMVGTSIGQLNIEINDHTKEIFGLNEYQKDEGFVPISEALESIRAKYNSYNSKYKENESGKERIFREITYCEDAMKKIEGEIVQLGYTLDTLNQSTVSSRINDVIINNKKKALEIQKKMSKDLKTEINKVHDKHIEFKTLFNDSRRKYEEIYEEYKALLGMDNLEAIQTSQNELKRKYDFVKKTISNLLTDISQLKAKLQRLDGERVKLNTFINATNLDKNVDGITEYDESLSFDVYEKRYKAKKENVDSVVKSFTKEVQRLIKETENYSVRNFREELEKLESPKTNQESNTIRVQMIKYQAVLDIQIAKIQLEIDKEKELKENYVKQCVDAGVWVYQQLMKLNSLSKIQIPDSPAKVEMVHIELNLFEDEIRYARMDSHINHLIEKIDKENMSISDIGKELNSKSFLAQVADMRDPKVYLYKVEDIASNSRRVRWENAVESDGQTHTIYFLFLATVVSFIRKLSTDMDATTKKVLIVDNPFGSASAVYLWRVMFEMLKQNNFQLISAGHNISKEILPFFDVNYIMTEEIMSDGSKKVVVSDFRGIVDKKGLTDEVVNLEQMTLF